VVIEVDVLRNEPNRFPGESAVSLYVYAADLRRTFERRNSEKATKDSGLSRAIVPPQCQRLAGSHVK
jgi:hypothetical protein